MRPAAGRPRHARSVRARALSRTTATRSWVRCRPVPRRGRRRPWARRGGATPATPACGARTHHRPLVKVQDDGRAAGHCQVFLDLRGRLGVQLPVSALGAGVGRECRTGAAEDQQVQSRPRGRYRAGGRRNARQGRGGRCDAARPNPRPRPRGCGAGARGAAPRGGAAVSFSTRLNSTGWAARALLAEALTAIQRVGHRDHWLLGRPAGSGFRPRSRHGMRRWRR
jgi:hypothetical protein